MSLVVNPQWSPPFNIAFRAEVGVPVPDITVGVGGVPVPCHDVTLPVKIVHGRSGLNQQPEAPSMSFTVLGRVPWARNDPVMLSVRGSTRFSGYIDSLEVGYAGDNFVTVVGCIGWQAKAGQTKPSIPPFGQEDDATRAKRYLDLFASLFPGRAARVQGAKTATLAAIDHDGGSSLLEILHRICESTGGLLWQAKDGALVYGTAGHRLGTTGKVFIDNCDIADGIEWRKDAGTLINRIKVAYGPTSARAEFQSDDAASVAADGPHDVSIDSILATENDAILLAGLILYRRAKAYWVMPGTVDVITDKMDASTYAALLDIEVSDVMLMNVPRTPERPASVVEWVVEGWTEEWAPGENGLSHAMTFALSDRQRFGITGIRTVGELAAGFTVATAGQMTVRNAMFKELAA